MVPMGIIVVMTSSRKVAKELESNIRKCDVLYRLVGGKFAILFTETGIAEAKASWGCNLQKKLRLTLSWMSKILPSVLVIANT